MILDLRTPMSPVISHFPNLGTKYNAAQCCLENRKHVARLAEKGGTPIHIVDIPKASLRAVSVEIDFLIQGWKRGPHAQRVGKNEASISTHPAKRESDTSHPLIFKMGLGCGVMKNRLGDSREEPGDRRLSTLCKAGNARPDKDHLGAFSLR
ncbi:hypothetical protein COCMIDRAFT_31128 [Bipolaris oryzae ATCC 44560]|uniref:Uncharacterized protein n=1 Tax=Bipolaris oryzae ATCC 44560 TaxID=930090 RepID=W6Z7Z0_COCMI|nr:uncharacterized protein COCMIDRAFT_31128 [Bipolaris oryzae ATCC 44560]EUC39806.1 hypothetical protein COCMIDRAFT_31128 [Bipolaris oryzae ATCC 44560]